jgi:hypothetical protein
MARTGRPPGSGVFLQRNCVRKTNKEAVARSAIEHLKDQPEPNAPEPETPEEDWNVLPICRKRVVGKAARALGSNSGERNT